MLRRQVCLSKGNHSKSKTHLQWKTYSTLYINMWSDPLNLFATFSVPGFSRIGVIWESRSTRQVWEYAALLLLLSAFSNLSFGYQRDLWVLSQRTFSAGFVFRCLNVSRLSYHVRSKTWSDSKEAEFKPPGLAKIFFQTYNPLLTLNYHTPRLFKDTIGDNVNGNCAWIFAEGFSAQHLGSVQTSKERRQSSSGWRLHLWP